MTDQANNIQRTFYPHHFISQSRIDFNVLTTLRGIAAFWVVVHHYGLQMFPDIVAVTPSLIIVKSYLWVDMFFILSGFVLAHVYLNKFFPSFSIAVIKTYFRARFARIYPVHIFMLLLFVGFETVQWLSQLNSDVLYGQFGEAFSNRESWLSLLANIVLLQTLLWDSYWNEPAWSISAEWITYCVMPLQMFLLWRGTLWLRGLSLILAASCLVWIELKFGSLGYDYAGWPMILRCGAEATFGIQIYFLFQQRELKRPKVPTDNELHSSWRKWCVNGLLFVTLLSLALPIPHYISVLSFVALIFASACLKSAQDFWLCWPPLQYLGLISYSLYLCHWLVMEVVDYSSFAMSGQSLGQQLSLTGQFACLASMIGVSTFFAHYLYRCVEMPCRDRLR